MTIYNVNIGHFGSFAEANRYRREKMPGKGFVFNEAGVYTIRLMSTPKVADAHGIQSKNKGLDVWVCERETGVKDE